MNYKKAHPDFGTPLVLTPFRAKKERSRENQRKIPRPHPCDLREVGHFQAPRHRQDQVSLLPLFGRNLTIYAGTWFPTTSPPTTSTTS